MLTDVRPMQTKPNESVLLDELAQQQCYRIVFRNPSTLKDECRSISPDQNGIGLSTGSIVHRLVNDVIIAPKRLVV